VRSARVHLVLPTPSLFLQEQQVAKASVVLKLKRPEIAPEQVEAIRRLVAGAVENLAPENVTLVDADGRLDLPGKSRTSQEADSEQALEAKLVAMLEPTVGVGNVRAIVNASYDEGVEDRMDDVYDPTQTATLSLEKTEQVSGPVVRPQGVPGTASNTPAAAPAGAVQGSATAAAPGMPPLLKEQKESLPVYPQSGFGQNQTMKQESGTYAVTRHTVHREDAPGRLQRMTVAVVVNDRMTVEGVGKALKTVWRPRSSEEMHRLEGLAQAAVGFDAKRGDAVVVENVGFSSNVPEMPLTGVDKVAEEAKSLMKSEPGLARNATVGLMGLLVVLLVLRPVSRQVVVALSEPKELPAPLPGVALLADGMVPEALGPGAEMPMELPNAEETQQVADTIIEHVRRKPVQSTRLLENWIVGPQEGS
jgi:flagellar M-ring protein FliF